MVKNDDYIVVRPVADRDKKFSWASNRLNRGGGKYPHLTYKTLERIVISLKKILNIDDNKIFAFGHSDGGDGAVGFSAYTPNLIASSVAYNTMMLCLFSTDYHIRNVKNRPLYAVHSDLDNLRPIQQERIIIDSLKKIGTSVSYREYAGYEHEDGHLNLDIPLVRAYLKATDRNPFANRRYWETSEAAIFNNCDWLKINKIDTTMRPAAWHAPFIIPTYDKTTGSWSVTQNYYKGTRKSAAVDARLINNVVYLKTSGVKEVQLFVSPQMTNMNLPVTVFANDRQVFKGLLKADKSFMINQFVADADRKAIWVNSINLRIE